MPKICYQDKNFRNATLAIILQANEIIEDYQAQGYELTLRQLYYQFVARDLLANTQKSYSRLGGIINDGRMAGLIDWNAIVDRTRNLKKLSTWNEPSNIIEGAAYSYRTDKWSTQVYRIEVWIEKEALAGVFERVCNELEVPFFSCRGYTSQSEMWRAAMRLKKWERAGFETRVLHFGDHDPSGMDMTRDIEDRLHLFGSRMQMERLALSMDQVQQYHPPPNPAKMTDSRFAQYAQEYGDESWELDALDPPVLSALVEERVLDYRDDVEWEKRIESQEKERASLNLTAEHWDEVVDYLDGEYPERDAKDVPDIFDEEDEDANCIVCGAKPGGEHAGYCDRDKEDEGEES